MVGPGTRDHWTRSLQDWVPIPAAKQICCMALGRFLGFSSLWKSLFLILSLMKSKGSTISGGTVSGLSLACLVPSSPCRATSFMTAHILISETAPLGSSTGGFLKVYEAWWANSNMGTHGCSLNCPWSMERMFLIHSKVRMESTFFLFPKPHPNLKPSSNSAL